MSGDRAAPPAWPYPRVLAHRGGGSLAPENTIAAIAFGAARGHRAVEFDAMLARDGVPVLIHDPTLDRTTDGRGAVSRYTAAELARLDAGGWHSALFAGEPVPALARALESCRALRVWANVEIKPAPGAEEATGAAVARTVAAACAGELRAGGDRARDVAPSVPLLSSFAPEALSAARLAAPDLPRALLCTALPRDWRERLAALGCVSLHCDHRRLGPAQAQAVKRAGFWLLCYTVDDRARALELMAWGVDAICTDRIDLIEPDLGAAPAG